MGRFNAGDLLKHVSEEWYGVFDGTHLHSIFDDSVPEGYRMIPVPSLWETVCHCREVPDALYNTHPYYLDGGSITVSQPCCCDCDIVVLMRTGCQCGGK